VTVPTREIEVDGEPASYREAGGGVVAIMTAGLGLSSRFYEASFPVFAAAGIRLVAPDLPGWGGTPGPHTGLGPAETADFLLEFADGLGIRRAVWIGHSLGAQTVVELATRRPDRAAGIVMVGPTGAPGRFPLVRQAYALTREAGRTSVGVLAAVAREYVRTPPQRYVGTWLRHSRHDTLGLLRQVQCPALILAGDADPICPPSWVALLAQRLPHAEVEWVPGGTHALPRGHVEAFNRAVIRFIEGLGR
jgi:pimeloyl-ACP methyl ester carboxylesterase